MLKPRIGEIVVRYEGWCNGIINGDICEIINYEYNDEFGCYVVAVKRLIDGYIAGCAFYHNFERYVLVEYEDVANGV